MCGLILSENNVWLAGWLMASLYVCVAQSIMISISMANGYGENNGYRINPANGVS